ncbi:unnamed protein product [Arctogadus glacialis]
MRRASGGPGRLAEPPSGCSGAPRASLFSLCVPRARVSLCVGPSPPPSLFSDREYDGSEEEDLDVETVFSSESGEFPSEQLPSPNPSGRELAHLFGEIVDRATKALNIVLPEKPTAAASRFEAEAEEGLRQTKVFSNMAGQEQVCCGALPAVDQDLAPLFRSPGSLFGGLACLNKDSKAMESLLGKLHRSTAMQARLANTAAILTLYTHHLSGLMQNQPVDASLAREFQSATLCLASVSKEQAVASGCSLAQLWVVRRHLWLSQSKLQPADRDCLLRVPVEPCLGHRPPPCCNRHGIAVAVRMRCQSPSAVGGSGQGAREHLHLGWRLSQ